MTKIIETVEKAIQDSRRMGDRFAVTVLSTLLGEMQNKIPKNADAAQSDGIAAGIVKKFIEGVDETIRLSPNLGDNLAKLQAERLILEAFMPSQLTDDQLDFAIEKIVRVEGKNKGIVMKVLKAQFPNQYDGKKAAALADKHIAA